MKRNLIMLTLTILLAGCATRMSSEVYFRDLDDLPDGDLTNKIVFHLPLPSTDECEEYKTRYNKVFKKSNDFKEMEYVNCVDGDMNDYIEYELDVPLRLTNPVESKMTGAVEFIRFSDEDAEDSRLIFIRSNPPSLYNLDELLEDEFYHGLDLSDTAPVIRLSNDLRSDQVFIVTHAFVQNKPVIKPTSFVLEPRDDIDIRLSDVTSAWIFHISAKADPRFALVGVWSTTDDDDNDGE
ncbi:MAG: hypothetical protein OXO48_12650 [Caldilineaceae bacterium]|nr:hypothetical protein [Caldilineaceae bacterium]